MILSTVNLKPELCREIEAATGERLIECGDVRKATPELLSQAEIIFTMGDFSAENLKETRSLKWLFVMSAGVDTLPFAELLKAGIPVSNVNGIHATQMAEQAIGEMITFSRRLHICRENQHLKKWERQIGTDELIGKELLIIGAGSIGREVARKANAFDMRVTGLKRHAEPLPNFDEVFGMEKFHEALPKADYTLLLTPLTQETRGLMGKEEFAQMKRGSIFLNFSRGAVVDEQALLEALQSGQLGGAALDVFTNEPLEQDSPFWSMQNVLVTPHLSGLSPHYFPRSVERFLKSYPIYKSGGVLPDLIDLKSQY